MLALYKMPPQVSFKDAVLLTTAGTGLYGLDAAGGYIVGYDIAIFGPGPVGLMTVQACKGAGGWSHHPGGDTEQPSQRWANALAPTTALMCVSRPGRRNSRPHWRRWCRRHGHRVFWAAETPQQCVQVTKRGGKILVVAFYPQPVTLDLSAVVRGDITIYTTRGEGAITSNALSHWPPRDDCAGPIW